MHRSLTPLHPRNSRSLYPFLEDSDDTFATAASILAEALKEVTPFTLTLPAYKAFMRKRSCTVWLEPVEEAGGSSLDQLHASLLQSYPQCDDTAKAGSGGFTPHLSVGQFGHKVAEGAVADLTAQREAAGDAQAQWTVTHVFLISRGSFTDPFHVRWRVPLGGGAPEAVAEGSPMDWVTDGALVLSDGSLSSESPKEEPA